MVVVVVVLLLLLLLLLLTRYCSNSTWPSSFQANHN